MHWVVASLVAAVFLGLYELCTKHAVHKNAVLPVLFLANVVSASLWGACLLWQRAQPELCPASLAVTPLNLLQHGQLALKSLIVASSWVAAYFDCSNMLKYGVPSAEWIRLLGPKRLAKFDFKGYSHKNSWCKIGEGDENWPEVLKALGEIGYDGWATSEVGGGGEEVLKDVVARMNKVLGLS